MTVRVLNTRICHTPCTSTDYVCARSTEVRVASRRKSTRAVLHCTRTWVRLPKCRKAVIFDSVYAVEGRGRRAPLPNLNVVVYSLLYDCYSYDAGGLVPCSARVCARCAERGDRWRNSRYDTPTTTSTVQENLVVGGKTPARARAQVLDSMEPLQIPTAPEQWGAH